MYAVDFASVTRSLRLTSFRQRQFAVVTQKACVTRPVSYILSYRGSSFQGRRPSSSDCLQVLGGPDSAFPRSRIQTQAGGEIAVISCCLQSGPRDLEHGDAEEAATALRGFAAPGQGGALSAAVWGRGSRAEAFGRNRSKWTGAPGAAAQATQG